MPIRIPAPDAIRVEVRVADLADRDRFGQAWRYADLVPGGEGFWQWDVEALGLADGTYEYEFVLDGDRARPVADPYATQLTRFGGYRAVLEVRDGTPWHAPFDWGDEVPAGVTLPDNNRIVVYEMPMRWMEGELFRQVGLGTFEKAAFMHLDRLADMGINCIELLPVQDSPDTLNWGYGTRFFFAPDIDMGSPVDLRWFVKQCHRRGIRVLMDVVMNHARQCPLERLAGRRYFIDPAQEPGRGDDYGGQMFGYRQPVDGRHWARLLHLDVARFWIDEYHVDGFRIDEFKGIDNWEFVQQFRDAAWEHFRSRFPDRPFLVVAEDSWARSVTTRDSPGNPGGRRVVDAVWDFTYRWDLRHLLLGLPLAQWGQAPLRAHIAAVASGRQRGPDGQPLPDGFDDLARCVGYITSHDVEHDHEQRFVNHVVMTQLRSDGMLPSGFPVERQFELVQEVDATLRTDPGRPDGMAGPWSASLGLATEAARGLARLALDRVRSAHAVLLTSATIPMLLAGEEFGDIHDTNHSAWQLKMSDPVDWWRQDTEGRRELAAAVADLIHLRTGHPALQRNEVELFHVHPSIDDPAGARVFGYCRTAGRPMGSGGQVVVVANLGPHDWPQYRVPWPWPSAPVERGAAPGAQAPVVGADGWATLGLAPFAVRVFQTHD